MRVLVTRLHPAVPELLLDDAGAGAGLADQAGNTALHLACSNVSAAAPREMLFSRILFKSCQRTHR